MNICIFYYDGFCEFEVAIAAGEFRSENLIAVALENRIYVSEERQKFMPDQTIAELNPEEIDLLIIPGGDPSYLYQNVVLKQFILELEKRNKYLAAICGGTELLAAYGVLDQKRCTGDSQGLVPGAEYYQLFQKAIILDEDVVVDGTIITSTGQAFVEFAFQLAKLMGVYENQSELEYNYRWHKNSKEN